MSYPFSSSSSSSSSCTASVSESAAVPLRTLEEYLVEIDNCEALQKKEQANFLRTQVCKYFLPDCAFWQSWLTDVYLEETSASDSPTAVNAAKQLFQKAMLFCPATDLIIEHLEHMTCKYEQDKITEEEMRSCFEECISICGCDIYGAGVVWKMYKDFEISEHADLVAEGAGEIAYEELHTAKLHVIAVYKRQLSIPQLGSSDVLMDFNDWLSANCTEHDTAIIDPASLNDKYVKAAEAYESRTPFEEALSSENYHSSGDSDKMKISF